MIAKRVGIALILFVVFMVADASAATVIVEITKNANINTIAASMGATIIDSMPNGSRYLLSVSTIPSTLPAGVVSMTQDTAMILPRFRGAVLNGPSASGLAPWYATQPAFTLINADKALLKATGRGVIIADIDSSIDVSHPALQGHLTTGHDFVGNSNPKTRTGATLEQSSASFLDQSSASFLDQSSASFLDQSSASFLDQSSASFLDQSSASFLDQSSASFLDQSSASFLDANAAGHGHATAVAGLIAALAPDALIMPLRAFDDTGTTDAFLVAKAVRYAVQNGAHIINLSLGLTAVAHELQSAIEFAQSNGVIVIASAGNDASSQPQYPAAWSGVIAVASTDLEDKKASFSNYGDWVFVSAPGVNLFTAYPGGYAIVSGTSFSSAIVAAQAALIRSMTTGSVPSAIALSAVDIDLQNPSYGGQLGEGRVDLLASLSITTTTSQAGNSKGKSSESKSRDRYIVIFAKGTGKANRGADASHAGATVYFNYDGVEAIAVEASANAINGLAHNPHVIDIVPDRPVFGTALSSGGAALNPAQVVPSGVTRVGAALTGSDGTGIGIAIMDTGIDLVNTDLAVNTKTFSAFGGSCQDDNGHGTAVAGVVSALNNTVGVVGVAPKSTPYCVKVLDKSANGTDANIIAGLDWINSNWNLVTPNIRVVNMSLGRAGTISDNAAYRTAIQNLYNKGIVIVTAAGNDANTTVAQRVPMAYPEVINVASTAALKGTSACKTQAAIVADSASYYTTDGKFDATTKTGITISAPGEDSEAISSTCAVSAVGMLTLNKGGGTVRASGTSISSPLVAGVVARMLQKGNSGVENIRNLLRSTAQLKGTAPIDSRISGYSFDGEKEGIAKAP